MYNSSSSTHVSHTHTHTHTHLFACFMRLLVCFLAGSSRYSALGSWDLRWSQHSPSVSFYYLLCLKKKIFLIKKRKNQEKADPKNRSYDLNHLRCRRRLVVVIITIIIIINLFCLFITNFFFFLIFQITIELVSPTNRPTDLLSPDRHVRLLFIYTYVSLSFHMWMSLCVLQYCIKTDTELK